MQLLGGELMLDFINVLLMTVLVAPLALWRYRRAVQGGMRGRSEAALPVAAAAVRAPAAAAHTIDPLAWERGLRRRLFVGVLGATAVPAVLLSVLYLRLGGMPMSPAHVYLKAAVLSSVAVPIFAVLTATPWLRALVLWVVTLVALAAGGALLAFGFAPPLGLRLTQWLTATATGTAWVLSGVGIDTGLALLALPIGFAAWWRVGRLARDYEAKRVSDALLLARTWWLLLVAVDAIELISVHPEPAAMAATLAVSVAAYLIASPLLGAASRRAYAGAPQIGRASCRERV